ncbi:MAG: hypothetical protein ACYDCK_12765 [Thermoplasmatota archaeon]
MTSAATPTSLRARWTRLPPIGRWLVAYAIILVLAIAVGLALKTSVGGPFFIAAAGSMVASAALIRTGGTRLGRSEMNALRKAEITVDERSIEELEHEHRERRVKDIRLGIRLFAFGVALAASAVGAYLLGV